MKNSVYAVKASDLSRGLMAELKRRFPAKYRMMKAAIHKYGPDRVSFMFDADMRPISEAVAY